MKVDLLTAEIGSTTTVVNAFNDLGTENPRLIGQGFSATTVLDGDVTIGLNNAIEMLKERLNCTELSWRKFLASSSAAGGLKMSVHGLVYDMTVKAAKEAALGAGANLHMVTHGRLRRTDLKKIKEVQPNIIMIAGGVNGGERDTAIENAEKIAELDLNVPVIYAGNIENHEEMREIFGDVNIPLYIVDNVYPSIDKLEVGPARKVIQEVFEEHIVHAPGMEHIRDLVDGHVIPTPAAVMRATQLLKEHLGDLLTFDVGGATTDVHSVTEGTEEVQSIQLSPEPEAKRTVEGDIGVYVNRMSVFELTDKKKLAARLNLQEEELEDFVRKLPPVPQTDLEISCVEELTVTALRVALNRHVGEFRESFTPGGKKSVADGRDLTALKYIVGTGGALTRLPHGLELLKNLFDQPFKNKLVPQHTPKYLLDRTYIMASLGVISMDFPEDAVKMLEYYLESEAKESV